MCKPLAKHSSALGSRTCAIRPHLLVIPLEFYSLYLSTGGHKREPQSATKPRRLKGTVYGTHAIVQASPLDVPIPVGILYEIPFPLNNSRSLSLSPGNPH